MIELIEPKIDLLTFAFFYFLILHSFIVIAGTITSLGMKPRPRSPLWDVNTALIYAMLIAGAMAAVLGIIILATGGFNV